MDDRSIVEYFAEHEGYKCGYCKSPNTNFSHGMWAHSMSTANYEQLLNRGWRRSGRYMYKPTNNITCCPMYTISCHALDFHITSSQKRVLKKFNHFMETGSLPTKSSSLQSSDKTEEIKNLPPATATSQDLKLLPSPVVKCQEDASQQVTHGTLLAGVPASVINQPTIKNAINHDNVLPPTATTTGNKKNANNPRKAKNIRIARRKERLLAKGLDPSLVPKKPLRTPKKSIEDFLSNSNKVTVKHFKTGTPEFEENVDASHKLYERYQMKVHKDTKDECAKKQFKRFLCESPLIQTPATGTYHDHYYLNNKLIAVGVVDILPTCLSSVYFFYDPDLSPLSLGTVGALYEIAFVRKSNLTRPDFKFYYMGFYIHSCSKMRYKGNFTPSYLLCPKTYSWHPLVHDLRKQLDTKKYTEFGESSQQNSSLNTNEDIKQVQILYRRCLLPYEVYKHHRKERDDDEEIQQYVNLVGSQNAKQILLYRSTVQ